MRETQYMRMEIWNWSEPLFWDTPKRRTLH
jgi:hypothetical protein